jgi:ELWxxDGT repeat protein
MEYQLGSGQKARCEALEPRTLLTSVSPLRDINTAPVVADLQPEITFDGALYCSRKNQDGLGELWKTDSTPSGTELLERTGSTQIPTNLTVFNDSLVYMVGAQLWTTSGAPGAARMVKDLDPGASSDVNSSLDVAGTRLYVEVSAGGPDGGLWVTDGTSDGTVHLPTAAESFLTTVGQTLYFQDSTDNLWQTDGTAAGSVLLRGENDVNAPAGVAGAAVVFLTRPSGNTPAAGLWGIDPATGAISEIASFPPDQYSAAQLGTTVDGEFYFAISKSASAGFGAEIWKTDGTPGGTSLVKAFDLEVTSLIPDADGSLFIVTIASVVQDDATLWRSDGTPDGTMPVGDLGNQSLGVERWTSAPDGTLYFRAGGYSNQIWRSDGSTAGTVELATVDATSSLYLTHPVIYGDGVYFSSAILPSSGTVGISVGSVSFSTGFVHAASVGEVPTVSASSQMWHAAVADTVATPVLGLAPELSSSYPSNLVTAGNLTFFLADDGIHGRELWATDGTSAGTNLVKDISPGDAGSNIFDMTAAGNLLFCVVSDGTGDHLWRSDGTADGTYPLAAVSDTDFMLLGAGPGSTIFFSENNTGSLWRSDGSIAGTSELADRVMVPGYDSFNTGAVSGGEFYFFVQHNTGSSVLWKSDGTPGGTVMVHAFAGLLNLLGFQNSWAFLGSRPVFLMQNPETDETRLWISDGTDAGTVPISGPLSDLIGDLQYNDTTIAVAGQHVFISGEEQLWCSDGTGSATGTVKLASFTGGISGLQAVGDRVYFAADNNSIGLEPWSSDGTPAHTLPLKDVNPGAAGSNPQDFTTAGGGYVFFIADDGQHGDELWQTDGTTAGTSLAADINPGSGGSISGQPIVARADGSLVFAADDGAIGTELWIAIPGPATSGAGTSAGGADPAATVRLVSPTTTIGGQRGFALLTLSNDGSQLFKGDVTVSFYMSEIPSLDASSQPLQMSGFWNRPIRLLLRPTFRRTLPVFFQYPSAPLDDGPRFIVAVIHPADATADDSTDNDTASSAAVDYHHPFTNLVAEPIKALVFGTSKRRVIYLIRLQNTGNIAAAGVELDVQAYDVSQPEDNFTVWGNTFRTPIAPERWRIVPMVFSFLSYYSAGSYDLVAGTHYIPQLKDPNVALARVTIG